MARIDTPKEISVKIADLVTNLYVRQELNEEHAILLAELLANGTALPPIKITPDHRVIDGRHRIEAHALCDRTEITAEVVNLTDEAEIIAAAYQANANGPLPPTAADNEHTIVCFLQQGVTITKIAQFMGLPTKLVRKYVEGVKAKEARARMAQAKRDVTDGGLSVPKSAEKNGVDPENLKEALGGRRQKKSDDVRSIQAALVKRAKSASSTNAALFRGLLKAFEDGDISAKEMKEIFADIKRQQAKQVRAVAQWERRFEAKLPQKGKKSVA